MTDHKFHRWRRASSKSKYFLHDKVIDFTQDAFPYEDFVIQQFFWADESVRQAVFQDYANIHGPQATAYLQRMYPRWQAKQFHLTEKMRMRILEIMTHHLPDLAREKIGLFEFSQAIKGAIRNHAKVRGHLYPSRIGGMDVNSWTECILAEREKIKNIALGRTQYQELQEEDAETAKSVARYILNLKLSNWEEQVRRDVELLFPFLNELNEYGATITYKSREFNGHLNLPSFSPSNSTTKFRTNQLLETNGTYQAYADMYFAYELSEMHSQSRKQEADSIMCRSDLDYLTKHISELLTKTQKSTVIQKLNGEGGTLQISVHLLPTVAAWSETSQAIAKIVTATSGIVLLILFIIWIDLLALLFYIGLPALYWCGAYVISQVKAISQLKKNLFRHDH